ncbi:MAG: hypothetical protein V1494_00630 [Candidatus Diapherotrites archaeon]
MNGKIVLLIALILAIIFSGCTQTNNTPTGQASLASVSQNKTPDYQAADAKLEKEICELKQEHYALEAYTNCLQNVLAVSLPFELSKLNCEQIDVNETLCKDYIQGYNDNIDRCRSQYEQPQNFGWTCE